MGKFVRACARTLAKLGLTVPGCTLLLRNCVIGANWRLVPRVSAFLATNSLYPPILYWGGVAGPK
jgi:hypothetical protein